VQEVGETFQGFTSLESSGWKGSLGTQMGDKDIDFVEETKVDTFGTWKIFQGK
jgi:hypothetical protein